MINIIGQIFGISGYDVHTRNLANALSKITEVRISTNLVPNWEKMVNDKELELIKRKGVKDEINLIVTNPIYWKLNCGEGRNWAYLVWEGDKVPIAFIEECLNPKIHKILLPSTHTRDALIRTIHEDFSLFTPFIPRGLANNVLDKIINKIKIVPHGVDLNLFYPMTKPERFTFLVNKGWRNLEDRGGTQYAVKAFIDEFTDSDDISLLIKVNPAYGIPDLNKMVNSLSSRKENLPKIEVDINAYDYKDMVKLYNKGTVFLAPTRAESYHLGCVEAMACGLPVITTNFGGQTDFINESNGWIIKGELNEVKHEIQYEGIKWLTPSIEELRKSMREAFTNRDKFHQKKVKTLNDSKENTWDRTSKILVGLI